jgi:hypothetical protein
MDTATIISFDRDDENWEDPEVGKIVSFGDRKVVEGRKVKRFERLGRSEILGG